jgi:hypothetical protein
MRLARFAFQACLIDRSSISPFRINNLRAASLIIAYAVQIATSSRHLVQMQRFDGCDDRSSKRIVIDLVISRDHLRRLWTDPARSACCVLSK